MERIFKKAKLPSEGWYWKIVKIKNNGKIYPEFGTKELTKGGSVGKEQNLWDTINPINTFSMIEKVKEDKEFPEEDNCPVCGDPIPDGMDFCSEDCELRSHDISDLEDEEEE